MRGLKLFAGTLVALWTVDVLVNLGFLQRLRADQLVGARSFLGLVLVDAQVAAICSIVAWGAAIVAGRVVASRSAPEEALAILAAGLCAVGVMIPSGVASGVVAAGLLWPTIRYALRRRPNGPWGFQASMAGVGAPLLVVGLAHHALLGATRGQPTTALAHGLGAALVLAVAVAALASPRAWMRPVGWVPAAAACVVALLLSAGWLSKGTRASLPIAPGAPGRPNIALIVIDTVRADHLRRFGYGRDTMPALERWGRDGLVVTGAISTAGWTSPSHASFFSGQTVSEHGVHYLYDARSGSRFWSRPVAGLAWLPAVLARQGYTSYAISANELAIPDEVVFHHTVAPRFVDWHRSVGAYIDRHLPWNGPLDEWLRWRMPYVEGDRIVEIVQATVPDDVRPVFLFVNLLDAHAPYFPPARILERMGIGGHRLFGRYATAWEIRQMWDRLPEGKDAYLAGLYDGDLRWLDGHLDRLLAWIDRHLGEDALVIVTSDHGELLGEGDQVGHDQGLASALIHVPLFIRGGGQRTGQLDGPVSLRHLYRLIERTAAGAEADLGSMQAHDDIGVLSERYPRAREGDRGRVWVSLVDEGFQVVGPSSAGLDVVRFPPGSDREDADPEVVRRLADRIDRYWETRRDRREEQGDDRALSPAELEGLRGLGYAE